MPMIGLEPIRTFGPRDFKSLASAYSATSAYLWRHHPESNWGIKVLQTSALPLGYGALNMNQGKYLYLPFHVWSGKRDSNSRHLPWQGNALPLSHSRRLPHANCSGNSIKFGGNCRARTYDRLLVRQMLSQLS